MKILGRNRGHDDIGIIAVGDSRQRIGTFDTGVKQRFTVESDAFDRLPLKDGSRRSKSLRIFIDHHDRVTGTA